MSTRTPSRSPKRVFADFYTQLTTDTYFRLTAAVIFVWGFFDTASTYIAIAAYGTVAHEWNPITRELLVMDPYFLTLGKAVAVLAIGLLAVYGRQHITDVPKWKLFFYGLIWAGILVSVVNLYAAYTAATGHDPVFNHLL